MKATCRSCGNYYLTTRHDSHTCSVKCRKAYSRGPRVYTGFISVSQDDVAAIFAGTYEPSTKDFTAAPPTEKWVPSTPTQAMGNNVKEVRDEQE